MESFANWLIKHWKGTGSAAITMIGIGAPMLWPELWLAWWALVGAGGLGLAASGFGWWQSRRAPVTGSTPVGIADNLPSAVPTIYRPEMELSEVACLAAGKEPALNITSGIELQLYRLLRDAANDGRLEMASGEGRGNFGEQSRTTVDRLAEFLERHPKSPSQLLIFAHAWTENPQPRHFNLKVGGGRYDVGLPSTSKLHPPTVAVETPARVSLREAATRMYEALRGTRLGDSYEENVKEKDGRRDPEELLDTFAMFFLNDADMMVKKPPSRVSEPFDRRRAGQMMVCDGARGLCFHGEKVAHFTEPDMTLSEAERIIEEAKAGCNEH